MIPKSIKILGKKKADWIRKGGLIEKDGYSQVSEKTHVLLAKMNQLGMITFDSQDGFTLNERAYVTSFMDIDMAKIFIELFNLKTDCLAMSVAVGDYSQLHRIPVTQSNNKADTRFPYILEQTSINHLMNQADIPKKMQKSVVIVECIDMRWGYRSNNKKGLFNEIIKVLNIC